MVAILRILLFAAVFVLIGPLLRRLMSPRRNRQPWPEQHRPPPQDGSPGQEDSRSMRTPSPYEMLEVSPQATAEEMRSAYRRKVQQYHPDRVAELGPEIREVAERRMKEINAAYDELKRRHGL